MDLSVVIVSFNTRELLKDCLSSIFKKTKGISFEVWVVDNASTDGSSQIVENEFSQVKMIKNQKNLGFAAANNQALRKTCGEYLLLLNSDTRLLEDSFTKMISFLGQKKEVGIASCQLLDKNGQIQASGGFFPNLLRVFAWMFFLDDLPFFSSFIRPFHPHPPSFYLRKDWYEKPHYQDWVTGAFFLMRRTVFENVGELDEKFFMYVEEMEYCFRAQKAGFKVFYTPVTKIVHLGGGSGTSKKAILGEFQGLKYFFQKHHQFQTPLLLLLLKFGAAVRLLLFGIIKGDRQKKEAYAQTFKEI